MVRFFKEIDMEQKKAQFWKFKIWEKTDEESKKALSEIKSAVKKVNSTFWEHFSKLNS